MSRTGRPDVADVRSNRALPMPHDVEVPTPEIAVFGHAVSNVLVGILGDDLVGVYFVGSVALGGYVPAESDVDIAAVSGSALSEWQKGRIASAIVEISEVCPARGVEFTLYRRDVAGSLPRGADFEINANGGRACLPPWTWTPPQNGASGMSWTGPSPTGRVWLSPVRRRARSSLMCPAELS